MKHPKNDLIGSDIFGLLVLAALCINRTLFSFFRETQEDVLIYKYNFSITSSHWMESLIPLKLWCIIWSILATLCLISIIWRKIRSVIFGIIILFVIMWGTSQIFSPQPTSIITGIFWINLSLILIWGASRISPLKMDFLHTHEEIRERR